MSDNEEERRVKGRHDVTQFYQRHPSQRTMSRQELPRADMSIENQPSAAREDERSEDDDVEEDTYMPSPQARPHGKGLASASGSRVARTEEIEEEDDGNDGANGDGGQEEEEIIDVEEITPTSYVHMGTPISRQHLNPIWRAKVRYKGKT
jgi:hypothetical protein